MVIRVVLYIKNSTKQIDVCKSPPRHKTLFFSNIWNIQGRIKNCFDKQLRFGPVNLSWAVSVNTDRIYAKYHISTQ